MRLFEGLPNEIVLHIIKETSPDDFPALASCCKHLHFLSQERLAYHKAKRHNADDVVVGRNMWRPSAIDPITPSAIHPIKHLQDILMDNDCRFYTKVMKIGTLSGEDPYDDEENGEEGPHMRAKTTLLAVIRSDYGRDISSIVARVYGALLPWGPHTAKTDMEQWTDSVKSGNPAAVAILLLALYPNLETLYIHEQGQQWWHDTEWGHLFRSLIKMAMTPIPNTMKILNRLSEFHLVGAGDDDDLEADAVMVVPFMALPAMCKIFCRDAIGRNVHWPYGTGTSGVTVFDYQGDIDTASLLAYISGFKALQHFRCQLNAPVTFNGRICLNGIVNRFKWGPRANDESAFEDYNEHYSDDDVADEDWTDDPDDYDRPEWEPRAIAAAL
ncbi:hypothetical protein IMSHALPRED_009846 [Imshaugia aleurites]|uniref:F-box domain-containing protein n=1 Tax=Imshaugia aleurites TaxID=172621 RepID=A0A8H3G232_9LECA|nr:hypothetical protein IMSHALPRED_009846 [Imshaugia aleurites]